MSGQPLLEARNLKVQRGGRTQLDILSLRIAPGETLALIGPNGAGKTTLLQILSGLFKPTRGEIFFRGQKVPCAPANLAYRRQVAMVFQEPLLFNTTVSENVAAGLKFRGVPNAKTAARVEESLGRFGIGHLRHRPARTLSGGEAQRTSLARALALQPEILLLDESFSSLDPPSRESLLEDLDRVLRGTSLTAVLATHDRMEALRLSDRIAVMNDGGIVQIGPPGEVMNFPANELVASFAGVETILSGKVIRKRGGTFVASVSGQEIEAAGEAGLGEEVVLGIRPENVTLSSLPSSQTTSARNVLPGRIARVTSLGFYHRIQLDCGFPLVAYVTGHSLESLSLEEGRQVQASFKATAIRVVHRGRAGAASP